MTNVVKFDMAGIDGTVRFGVSYRPGTHTFNDDLGRGGCEIRTYFKTEEGREYYIQMEELRDQCNAVIGRLESDLRYVRTIRGANQNLREVRAANRRAEERK